MQKMNCWEFNKCGREPGGTHRGLGICPAATTGYLDNIHGGRHAGRACWVIPGTFCNEQVQGSYAQKFERCEQCSFYQSVRHEEGKTFMVSVVLLHIARGAFEATQKSA